MAERKLKNKINNSKEPEDRVNLNDEILLVIGNFLTGIRSRYYAGHVGWNELGYNIILKTKFHSKDGYSLLPDLPKKYISDFKDALHRGDLTPDTALGLSSIDWLGLITNVTVEEKNKDKPAVYIEAFSRNGDKLIYTIPFELKNNNVKFDAVEDLTDTLIKEDLLLGNMFEKQGGE